MVRRSARRPGRRHFSGRGILSLRVGSTGDRTCKLERMLDRIQLRFGPHPGAKPSTIELSPVTVFVGPNNSGKSLVFREIEQFINTGGGQNHSIVDRIFAKRLDPEEVSRLIEGREIEDTPGAVTAGRTLVAKSDPTSAQVTHRRIEKGKVLQIFQSLSGDGPINHTREMLWQSDILPQFVSLYTVRLDGKSRFALTDGRQSGNFLGAPQNHLMALFQNDEAREELREATDDAFGLHAVLDPHSHGNLRIRMSDRPPADPSEEQNWDARSRAFHMAATEIERFSDGVKAFTGLIAAVLSNDFRVIMVDEPDAFLHPTLARKLGSRLAALALDRGGNVLAATHSPEFLMGCVEAGDVNVVRLTYRREVPSARTLAASDLREMMRDPLLRSTGVLSALFYEGAVVCEADADRAFYQEVNYRLVDSESGGTDGSIFLNAQNWQTIRKIVRPLRIMGIPAAAIVDLDVIGKNADFKELMKAALVPQGLVDTWGVLRGQVERAFRDHEVDMKKGGIVGLPAQDREVAHNLLDGLAQYGIFVVPLGELESWLRMLGERPPKHEWVPKVFELMSADPKRFKPQEGDVWAFIREVAGWIGDPNRTGMPE